MTIYIVTQTLCQDREVMVEASSKQEAIDKARDGYGEIITPAGTRRLLCSDAKRAEA